ncbi:MAG TPA: glycosyl hydrolase family 28-related protein [Thermoleophilaceae bacterium]
MDSTRPASTTQDSTQTRRRLLAAGAVGAAGAGLLAADPARAQLPPLDDRYVLRERMPLNVKDYGALGNGSTDDTASCQAAIDAAAAAGGGAVFFPTGNYIINGGLTVPASKPIRLFGAGMAPGGSLTAPTRLKRNSDSTSPIIKAHGTSFSVRAWVEVVDMDIEGKPGVNANGLDLQRAQHVYLHRVRVASCNGHGILMKQVFNSCADTVQVSSCGNGTGTPAMLLDSITGGGGQGGNDTSLYTSLQFEGNGGTDLKIDGSQADTSPSSSLEFTGVKFEANPGNTPYIDLAYCQAIKFSQVFVNASGSAVPIQMTHPFGLGFANQFANLSVNCAGGTAPYAIKLGRGALQLSNVNVISPQTAAIRVESTASPADLQVSNLWSNGPRISDARSRSDFVRNDVNVVPQARVFNSTNISIPNNTITSLYFDSERYDLGTQDEQHVSGGNQLICKVPGLYRIGGSIRFDGTAGTMRELRIRLNGGAQIASTLVAPAPVTRLTVNTEYRLAAGDAVDLTAFHDAGFALSTIAEARAHPEFWFSWVSP